MLFDNAENNHAVLIKKRQPNANVDIDTHENFPFYLQDQL